MSQTAKKDVEALKQSTDEDRKKSDEKKSRGRKKGRIRELEEIRAELAENELVLLSKERELLERDQSVQVLREEVRLTGHLACLTARFPSFSFSASPLPPFEWGTLWHVRVACVRALACSECPSESSGSLRGQSHQHGLLLQAESFS